MRRSTRGRRPTTIEGPRRGGLWAAWARRFGIGGLAAFLIAGAAAAECVLYSEPDFSGDYVVVEDNEAIPRFGRLWNDRISSIKTSAECHADIYEHWNYEGRVGVIDSFTSFQEDDFWNDRMSAVSCRCPQPVRLQPRRGTQSAADDVEDPVALGQAEDVDRDDDPTEPAVVVDPGETPRWMGFAEAPSVSRRSAACIVYQDPGFTGAWRAFTDGETNRGLGRPLFDAVRSVEVARGCYALLGADRQDGFWTAAAIGELDGEDALNATNIACVCR